MAAGICPKSSCMGVVMNLSSLFAPIGQAWDRLEAFVIDQPELGGIGIAVVAGLLVALLFTAIVSGINWLTAMRRQARALEIHLMTDFGARVVLINGRGARQRAITRFMHDALKTNLPDFMFGGPFRLISYPGKMDKEAAAMDLLKRSDADLLIWPESKGGQRVVRIASRPASPFEKLRPPQHIVLPKEKESWNKPLARALAYAAAKQFRPALGRPQDFRSERLQPVVETLLQILDTKPKADPRLLAEMVDDASAGALQLAFAGDDAWLDRSVDIARTTLADINRSASPDRWIAAKITLGRALRLRAEKRFDPVLLQEAIAQLSEALEALRSEPRFKLAEAAAQAIGDAQRLLGARRKFSITGGRL
jgi:hypothetical protein